MVEATRRTNGPVADNQARLEVLALALIAVLLIAAVLLTRVPSAASLDLSQRLQVRSGDSLWTVATSHPVQGLTTAQLTDLLAEANNLHGRTLRPGQVIRVPAVGTAQRVAAR